MYQVLGDKLGFVSIVVSICAASALKARRAVPAGTAGILSNDACVFFAAVPDITEAGQIATYALQPMQERSRRASYNRARGASLGRQVGARKAQKCQANSRAPVLPAPCRALTHRGKRGPQPWH